MLIIGDIHGKHDEYLRLIKNEPISLQLGDFGFIYENMPSTNHKFVCGNHDNWDNLPLNGISKPQYFNGFFCIPGAYSIDKEYRTPGISWFPNEELSYLELRNLVERFADEKPRLVASHDCPYLICEQLFNINEHSRTRLALQSCLDEWQPDIWVFGHHHKPKDVKMEKTRFICLDELQTICI